MVGFRKPKHVGSAVRVGSGSSTAEIADWIHSKSWLSSCASGSELMRDFEVRAIMRTVG